MICVISRLSVDIQGGPKKNNTETNENVAVMGTDNRTHFSFYNTFIQSTLRPACGPLFPEQGTIPG